MRDAARMTLGWLVVATLVVLAGCVPRVDTIEIADPDLLDLLYPPPPSNVVPGWITHPRTRRQWLEEPWNRPWLWHQHHCRGDWL